MPPTFPDIVLEFCSRADPRYKAIRDEHYVTNKGAHGQQAHFLVWYKKELAGIISGGSSVWGTAPRDAFFKITKKNHKRSLNGIVDNMVFRLINNEPNLATRVLSLWRKVVPCAWDYLYGIVPYGYETFVVENDTRKGSLYKADNWTLAGTTAGSAKTRKGMGVPHTRKSVVPKLVFCRWRDEYPVKLRDDYTIALKTRYKPSWPKKTPAQRKRAKTIDGRRSYLNGRVFYIRQFKTMSGVMFTLRKYVLPEGGGHIV